MNIVMAKIQLGNVIDAVSPPLEYDGLVLATYSKYANTANRRLNTTFS